MGANGASCQELQIAPKNRFVLFQYILGGSANKDASRSCRRRHVEFSKLTSFMNPESVRPERNTCCLGALPLQRHGKVAKIPFDVRDVNARLGAHR
jgi:hypothetical protein